MSAHDSTNIVYLSLDFLGFLDYRVGDDGSVWTCRRRGAGVKVTDDDAEKIREKYQSGKFTQSELAVEFSCSRSAVGAIINKNGREKQEWRRMTLGREEKNGYVTVRLCREGQPKKFLVHRLVLLAFVGPCPEGMECCHFPDRNPENNNLYNLRWGTLADQYRDKIAHGTHYIGERLCPIIPVCPKIGEVASRSFLTT